MAVLSPSTSTSARTPNPWAGRHCCLRNPLLSSYSARNTPRQVVSEDGNEACESSRAVGSNSQRTGICMTLTVQMNKQKASARSESDRSCTFNASLRRSSSSICQICGAVGNSSMLTTSNSPSNQGAASTFECGYARKTNLSYFELIRGCV